MNRLVMGNPFEYELIEKLKKKLKFTLKYET